MLLIQYFWKNPLNDAFVFDYCLSFLSSLLFIIAMSIPPQCPGNCFFSKPHKYIKTVTLPNEDLSNK